MPASHTCAPGTALRLKNTAQALPFGTYGTTGRAGRAGYSPASLDHLSIFARHGATRQDDAG
jgi:hypothetical protein